MRELLETRGLNEEVTARARDLLARIGAPPDTSHDSVADGEARAKAEQHLWSGYLEWSGIARVAIRDRRVLASLGFRRPGS